MADTGYTGFFSFRKMVRRLFFNPENQLRLPVALVVFVLLVLLSEILVVDQFEHLTALIKINAHTFDALKRVLRIVVILFSVVIFGKYIINKPLGFFGFVKHRIFLNLLLGVVLGFTCQLVAGMIMHFAGWYKVTGFVWNYNDIIVWMGSIIYALIFCIETGFIEEVVFRGVLLNLVRKRYNNTIGIVVSSVVFGMLHFSGFDLGFPWWLSVLSSVLAGWLFAESYLLFGNIWLPMSFHASWHFAMRVLGTPGVEAEDALLLVTEVNGPAMWVATKSGGAGLVEVAGMIWAAFVILFMRKINSLKNVID